MTRIHARLLGGFAFNDEDGAELRLATRKAGALLAFLIVEADKWHTRDRLAGLMWSDRQQAQARHSLTQALSTIRKLGEQAGATLIESDSERVRLLADAVSADTLSFRESLDCDATKAAEFYAGPFLDGFAPLDAAFEEWLATERAAFQEQACTALSSVIDHAEASGSTVKAVAAAKRWLALDPYAEPAHRRLMQLHAVAGDRAEAIRQYHACEKLLREELDVSPSTETRKLLEEIKEETASAEPPDEIDPTSVLSNEQAPPLPDRPSIAVLPFANPSGDPEQEFFADGMTEDTITGLSKFRWLFVIARNSSFSYKGKSPDVRDVARDLGVRYVLEGSVRRGGARLRITAQLIDAETGNHIWAERYDRELADIFAVQDEVTAAIVATIAPEIGQSEIERMKRRAPESLDAWALFQQGMALYPSGAAKDYRAAIDLFDKAHKLDPGFVEALVMAGHMRTRYVNFFDMDNRETLLEEARELLQTAMRLDPGDATCRMAMGRWYVVTGEPEIGAEYCREAVTLNPNSVLAHFELGIALNAADRYEEALVRYDTARRLSPRDLHASALSTGPTFALFMLGRFEEAAATAARVSRSPNPRYWADALLVAALLRLGRKAEVEAAKEVLLERKPDFTIGEFQSSQRGFEGIAEQLGLALREAGLPE
jgi:TolB-like protein/DNA-binding SARP family transcriptional activator